MRGSTNTYYHRIVEFTNLSSSQKIIPSGYYKTYMNSKIKEHLTLMYHQKMRTFTTNHSFNVNVHISKIMNESI